MKSKYFIDDQIVIVLLKNDKSEIVWKTVFEYLRIPFIRYFEKNNQLGIDEARSLYIKTFSLLLELVKNERVGKGLKKTLFKVVVELALSKFLKSVPPNIIEKSNHYMASDILIQLVKKDHNRSFNVIFELYRNPSCAILQQRYGFCFNLCPLEIYGEAMLILKKNINSEKVTAPMNSRLFTYFIQVTRNKYLELANRMKPLVAHGDVEILESYRPAPNNGNTYIDYIEKEWPILSSVIYDSGKEVFETLLSTFSKEEQELIKLRFEEGVRYKEIANQLSIREGACRKRLHDCLKKWKIEFFKKYVIQDATDPCQSYLKLYLCKAWSVAKIASRYNVKVDEVSTTIEYYLQQWRQRRIN